MIKNQFKYLKLKFDPKVIEEVGRINADFDKALSPYFKQARDKGIVNPVIERRGESYFIVERSI